MRVGPRFQPLPLLLALSGALGCASVPPGRRAIDRLTIEGAHAVPASEIEERIATAESSKLLGLFRGVVFDYELLDPRVLERDLTRIERLYRARGYYDAHARAGRVVPRGPGHVEVEIVVDEGPLVRIGKVAIAPLPGTESDPPGGCADARQANPTTLAFGAVNRELRPGAPLDEEALDAAENAGAQALRDAGRPYADVRVSAEVDLARAVGDLTIAVRPGPPACFGEVTIEGRGEVPEEPIRRALHLRRGRPYSASSVESAERSVLDLGVFSQVEVKPDLRDRGAAEVPIVVRVRPTELRSVRLGGGVELDPIRTDLHGQIGWEDRNFLGGLRRVRIDVKPGVVLYPTRLPTLDKPTSWLPEEKTRVDLRQPGFLEPRTAGVVRGELDVYPVLLTTDYDPSAPILGYREARGSAGLERRFFRKVFATLYQQVQLSVPFTYEGGLDPSLRSVTISDLALRTQLDLRDDAIRPHQGVFVGNELQVAGLGGDARDLRVQPEIRGYVPISKRVTFAVRASTGFLFPDNYGTTFADQPGAAELSDPAYLDRRSRDIQLVYFRAFFSGGPSSNRGYPFRGVGPHGVVPFFHPGLAARALAAQCDPHGAAYDEVRCAVPLGGLSLWEASAEIRWRVVGPFLTSTFCDASDVTTQRLTLRIDHPHLSCGLGVRYDTPVGPLRLDVGWRLPGLQVPAGTDPRVEGDPGTLFGAPVAVALGIGEAF